jgi:hypothetical protein
MSCPYAEVADLADFIALYRGRTISEAELVAVSAEQHLVQQFFAELVGEARSESVDDDTKRLPTVLEVVRNE